MLLPSCSSDHACSLPKDEGACFYCILTTMGEKSAVCSLYGGCRGKRATVLFLESIVRHFVSVSKSRFAFFKQYNVNNVKLKQLRFSTQLEGKNVQWCLKAKRFT